MDEYIVYEISFVFIICEIAVYKQIKQKVTNCQHMWMCVSAEISVLSTTLVTIFKYFKVPLNFEIHMYFSQMRIQGAFIQVNAY